MRYLITGGAGFIGSHLADALVARGDDVLVLDDLSTGSIDNVSDALASGRAQFVEGSVCDEAAVDECMEWADACFHLASAVGVKLIVDRSVESLGRSVRGAQVVTEGAHRLGRRFLFASTSEIYGKNSSSALTEHSDRVLGPPSIARWSYSTAKAFGEALALGYHRERDSDNVVVRLFNTVGPRQTGAYGMVLPRFVGQALAGEDLTVFGDGSQSLMTLPEQQARPAVTGEPNRLAILIPRTCAPEELRSPDKPAGSTRLDVGATPRRGHWPWADRFHVPNSGCFLRTAPIV